MKKSLIFLFSAIVLSVLTFSVSASVRIKPKVTDTKIANMIERSAEINRDFAGVTNPDLIYPGQELFYLIPGEEDAIQVLINTGDCQWKVVKNVLNEYYYGNPNYEAEAQPAMSEYYPNNQWDNFLFWLKNIQPWQWGIVIVLLLIAIIFLLLGYMLGSRRNVVVTINNPQQAPAQAPETSTEERRMPNGPINPESNDHEISEDYALKEQVIDHVFENVEQFHRITFSFNFDEPGLRITTEAKRSV